MQVQEIKMAVGFYSYNDIAGKKLNGTLFLNINPEKTTWYDEVKQVLIKKGYIDDSYYYHEESYPYDGGDFYYLASEDYGKAFINLLPFWATGEILTNE